MAGFSFSRQRLWVLLLLLPSAGCAAAAYPPPVESPMEGRLITREEIERSGARDAWELLRRSGTHLQLVESSDGEPLQVTRRGPLSSPRVVLDGQPVRGYSILRDLNAHDIESIQIVNGVTAFTYFGSGGSGGAILIRTRSARLDGEPTAISAARRLRQRQ